MPDQGRAGTTPSDMDRVRAGRALLDAMSSNTVPSENRRRRGANELGLSLFGGDKHPNLRVCSVCGCIGEVGDDCGRAPDGHTLVTR